jgi:hypothetical protein
LDVSGKSIKRNIDAGNMSSNFTVKLLHSVATRTHVNFTWGVQRMKNGR